MMIAPDCRSLFPLGDPTYLNHGGYGMTPREVLAARAEKIQALESMAGPFFGPDFHAEWTSACDLVASRFHLPPKSLALVANATDGMNAVLRSFPFEPGDEILITSLNYGGIKEAISHLADKKRLGIVQAELRFPDPDPEQFVRAVRDAITPRTKLAVFDHVTSSTALVMPIAEMAKVCRERGVAVAVDGAHVPGNISFDIEALGIDWYAANLHKWHFVPRGCGFLWASPNRRKELAPAILSWGCQGEFPDNFEWTGTHDPTPWLSVPDAFRFMDKFGEEKVLTHNHGLVRESAAFLAKSWKTRTSMPEKMTGSMALIALPDNLPFAKSKDGRAELQNILWSRFKIDACIPSHSATAQNWVRISAQIYNGHKDYEKLDEAIRTLASGK